MENKVSQIPEFKRYYLSEFELYDGEEFITFNIVGIDAAKNEIQIAVTNRGKITHLYRRIELRLSIRRCR